jgi:hypothetical protein
LFTTTYAFYYVSAAKIDTNKVFVAHRNGNYLYGAVCTISGTDITVGTDTMLSDVNNSYYNASAVTLGTDKVFVAHRNGDYLYGVVCTISNTTITAGVDTQLSDATGSYTSASAAALGSDKVFVAHQGPDGNSLCGIVCAISGTTITVGNDKELSSGAGTVSSDYASAVALGTGKVFVAHRYGSFFHGIVCAISGTTVIPGADAALSSDYTTYTYASTVALDSNNVFIAHRNNNYLYGMVSNAPDITVQTSSTKIDGLTKTECTTSTAGEVWVLNT